MSAPIELVREELRQFAGYSSARKEAAGGSILLNANESPWAGEADRQSLNRYPQPQPSVLLDRLAALYGVDASQLLVGRGSDEAIDLLTRALCRAGRDAGVGRLHQRFELLPIGLRRLDLLAEHVQPEPRRSHVAPSWPRAARASSTRSRSPE